MTKEYVENRDGGYYVSGTRVSLDSVVYAFLRGESPEGIVDSFPLLNLEQAFGAVAFYLANRAAIDSYLTEQKAEFVREREAARARNPLLYAKLDSARQTALPPNR